jgi:hypothetical protein
VCPHVPIILALMYYLSPLEVSGPRKHIHAEWLLPQLDEHVFVVEQLSPIRSALSWPSVLNLLDVDHARVGLPQVGISGCSFACPGPNCATEAD